MPIDPHPGPRSIAEIRGGQPLSDACVLADARTATPEGVAFAESGMAAHLGQPTVLVDIGGGPGAVGAGVAAACRSLGCDLAVFLDVGGDVLATGIEPGLASPLCDAVMLAAAARLRGDVATIAAVYGPGCDGELTAAEVLERIAELERAGGVLGSWGLTPAAAAEIEAAGRLVPTEASLQAVRCFRGERGEVPIRGGRRRVRLTAAGALTYFFDPAIAVARAAPLAAAVADSTSLEHARDRLAALGVRTELDYEREVAAS